MSPSTTIALHSQVEIAFVVQSFRRLDGPLLYSRTTIDLVNNLKEVRRSRKMHMETQHVATLSSYYYVEFKTD